MTRQTKAELLAENLKLCERNEELEKLVAYQENFVRKLRLELKAARQNPETRKAAEIMEQSFRNLIESVPQIQHDTRSKAAADAANIRWAVADWTQAKLKEEYRRVQKKLGPDSKPTTIYKKMAKMILKDEKYWRRIRTAVERK